MENFDQVFLELRASIKNSQAACENALEEIKWAKAQSETLKARLEKMIEDLKGVKSI
jgi:hypothetical protein